MVEERKFDRNGREILCDAEGRRVKRVEEVRERGEGASKGRIEEIIEK